MGAGAVLERRAERAWALGVPGAGCAAGPGESGSGGEGAGCHTRPGAGTTRRRHRHIPAPGAGRGAGAARDGLYRAVARVGEIGINGPVSVRSVCPVGIDRPGRRLLRAAYWRRDAVGKSQRSLILRRLLLKPEVYTGISLDVTSRTDDPPGP